MVDTVKSRFPETYDRPSTEPLLGLESYATESLERVKAYAQKEPIKFGLIAMGVGFFLGWRLKPW